MLLETLKSIDFCKVANQIWVAKKHINVPAYDFGFEPYFPVARPRNPGEVQCFARVGAIPDYGALFEACRSAGFLLVHTPAQHLAASELPLWYPKIKDFTPRSKVYDTFPALETVLADFAFPVFVKGSRQTSRHSAALSVARNAQDWQRIAVAYQQDAILHWQQIVVREFVPLMPLGMDAPGKVQLSREFRTFWWRNQCVGAGHYWAQYLAYGWTAAEQKEALSMAEKVANLLDLPFVAIDLAQTQAGEWIVIEVNDAQESGYCGVKPATMWGNILQLERERNSA